MPDKNFHFKEAMEQATGQKFSDYSGPDDTDLSEYGISRVLRGGETPHYRTHSVVSGTLHGPYGPDKTQTLYDAEQELTNRHRSLRFQMSIPTARDMAEEIIFHPIMDTIPHIDTLRKIWNPKQIHGEFPDDLYSRRHAWGTLAGAVRYETGEMYIKPNHYERHNRRSNYRIRPITVTHETAHLLASPWYYGVHSNILGGVGKFSPQHGWMMAKIHTMAVEAALGTKEAERLKSEYRKAGIDFGESGTEVDPWDHIPKQEQ